MITLAVVAVSALVLAIFGVGLSGSEETSYLEDFWQSLLRVLDPGTMAADVGWGRRVLALVITLFGLLVAGTLIGVIAAGVEERIDRMRRARSAVFETGHVVILGASDRLPLLVQQLVLARAHRRSSVLVVMADRDPTELQESVRRVVHDRKGSRLVFRSGDPTHPPDLGLARLREAEMVIVLGDEAAGDPRAIRTVVAVAAELQGLDPIPIVVELEEPASADRLTRVYGSHVHPLVPRQAVARIAAVALREPGAGQVAIALLDDRGSDIHVSQASSLEGQRFVDALEAFPTARPIGIMRADGHAELNPPPESAFGEGDRIVLISESPDEHPVSLSSDSAPSRPFTSQQIELNLEQPEQHLLVLGWSDLGAYMLADWAAAAAPSSTIEVMLDPDYFDGSEVTYDSAGPALDTMMSADPSDLVARLAAPPSIDTILMCTSTRPGNEAADSRTLLGLVGIRRVLETLPGPQPRVIVELLDVDDVALADMPNPDDFVVSDAIASQLIAQLAEQPERRSVFLSMYEPEGASIRLIPAGSLGLTGLQKTSDIYRVAYQAGVLAIGWRRPGSLGDRLVLNPSSSQHVNLDESDQIVAIG